jgi:alkylation response protein AidB-like acyl-CoA dehydrogenase
MDFTFSEEHELLHDTVRLFSETELFPLVREVDNNEIFPRKLFSNWGEMSLIAACYSEAVGGGGF